MVLLKRWIKARPYTKVYTFFLIVLIFRGRPRWGRGLREADMVTPQSTPLLLEKTNFTSTFLKGAFTLLLIRKFRNNKFHISKFSHFCISPRR